jgi:hypothetical protein
LGVARQFANWYTEYMVGEPEPRSVGMTIRQQLDDLHLNSE